MQTVTKKRFDDLVKKGAKVIDMRSPVSFRDGSVPGAVNLPLKPFLNKLMAFDVKEKIILIGTTLDLPDLKTAYNYADKLGCQNVYVADYNQLI
jgi:3-mercaptopyruvate sulfurtransferase SseA